MGIKGLWAVLTPYSEKKSLHEIRGETLAVDLSGWVCDSQNVTEYHVQPKLYLRNLFFRTAYLVLADINPIFVLEGDAPELKRDVMAARNQVQFRGAAPRSDAAVSNKRPDVARKRFRNVLKECESLLKCLGVRCIKGQGEAEATCAALNAQNLVDAVVSQDSDCFAYGARRVYRNFSVSNSAGGGALQGSVDCYDAHMMYQTNGFGRNKMVALALLCGCDYGVGACGSSINTAVSFLHTIPENEVIPRLLSWVTDVQHYEEQTRWVGAPGRCDRCGHFGRHGKNGCPVCATHRGCNDTGHKTKMSEVKRELSLRNRALTCGAPFPEPKVMKEFMNTPMEKVDLNKLKNPILSLIQFVKLMSSKLDWSERYCVGKFLPLLTKFHLQDNVPNRTIKATAIKKKRNPRGVPSYEVVWADIDGQYAELIPDDQFEDDEDPSVAWTTVERQDLMRKYYSEIVESYEESIKKPPKEKKTRSRKKKEPDDNDKPKRKYNRKPKTVVGENNLNESMKALELKKGEQNNSALNVSVPVNKLNRKIKNNTKKGQKTLISFIASKKRRTSKKLIESLRQSFGNISLKCPDEDKVAVVNNVNDYLDDLFDGKENIEVNESPLKSPHSNKHYLSLLNQSDDDDDADLSDIIDNIVAQAPEVKTAKVENNLVKLIFDKYSTPKKIKKRKSILTEIHNHCSTPNDSPIAKSKYRFSTNSPMQKINTYSTPIGSPVNKSKFRFSMNSPVHQSILSLSKNMSKRKSILNSSVGSCNNSITGKVNTSYFFDKLTEDGDAFEMSLEHKSAVVVNLDSTVDYSLPDVCL